MNVRIEKLVYGGEGLGHAEGKTIFVPFVLPGEVVAIRAVEQKKKFIRGQMVHLVTPAAGRIPAACPHFTACGGCHYQHIPYESQLEAKAVILRETLARLGRIAWTGPIHAHASPPFEYRNRAQWKVRPLGGRPSMGYFRAASSALCAVEVCPVLSPRLQTTLATLRGLFADGTLSGGVREIEAFVDGADQRILLNVSLADSATSAAAAHVLATALPHMESLLLHDAARDTFTLEGPGFLTYRVADAAYRVGHLSFFQSNRHLIAEMLATITAGRGGRLALDLFAGVGLFSLPLSRQFDRVIAVESNPAAARNLSENLAGIPAAQAENTDVLPFLHRQKERPDFVLLDPPRAGVAPPALRRVAALAPAQVGYLSCDPATLARDLADLTAAGYSISAIHLFDVFPQTFHIETFVLLEHNPGSSTASPAEMPR